LISEYILTIYTNEQRPHRIPRMAQNTVGKGSLHRLQGRYRAERRHHMYGFYSRTRNYLRCYACYIHIINAKSLFFMLIQDFKIKICAVSLYMIIKGDKLVLHVNLVPVLSMVLNLVLVLNLTTIRTVVLVSGYRRTSTSTTAIVPVRENRTADVMHGIQIPAPSLILEFLFGSNSLRIKKQ
jgi:hypothetical protein